jgi:hypothetical protein
MKHIILLINNSKRNRKTSPQKNITERHFNNKPEEYPNVLMTNEPVDWEESQNNLTTRPYRQAFFQGGAMEDDFGIR